MSQRKICCRCDYEGPLSDFERWDKLCRTCRAEAGPMVFTRPPMPEFGLTRREGQVLELSQSGLGRDAIASRLHLPPLVVSTYSSQLRKKGYEIPMAREKVAA